MKTNLQFLVYEQSVQVEFSQFVDIDFSCIRTVEEDSIPIRITVV
jgi:hypothetical protein